MVHMRGVLFLVKRNTTISAAPHFLAVRVVQAVCVSNFL